MSSAGREKSNFGENLSNVLERRCPFGVKQSSVCENRVFCGREDIFWGAKWYFWGEEVVFGEEKRYAGEKMSRSGE